MSLEDLVKEWLSARGHQEPDEREDKRTMDQIIADACFLTKNKSQMLFATRINREIDAVTFNDWDDMYGWLLGLAPNGLGPVSVFTVATALGEALKIPRTSLYLRGDIRTAWNKLHGTRRVPEVDGKVPAELLPDVFRGMTAQAIEAFLQFNIDRLEPWLRSGQRVPDWLAQARANLGPEDAVRLDQALAIIGDRDLTTEAPVALLSITEDLVDRFAAAMKTKLLVAQLIYGYADGWVDPTWHAHCLEQFRHHIAKGDPVDVANYCAFMYHHEWPTNGKWEGDGAP